MGKEGKGGAGWGRAVPLQVREETWRKCEGIWDLNRFHSEISTVRSELLELVPFWAASSSNQQSLVCDFYLQNAKEA